MDFNPSWTETWYVCVHLIINKVFFYPIPDNGKYLCAESNTLLRFAGILLFIGFLFLQKYQNDYVILTTKNI